MNKKRLQDLNSGFTLVEILVTATIVAILSSIGMTGFQAITRSGRDALRKSDLEQVRSALEIYKAENGVYPNHNGNCHVDSVVLPTGYIQNVPTDPTTTNNYCYLRGVSNLTYTLCAHLENVTTGDILQCGGPTLCGPGGGGVTCNYMVTNP